jgi:hypothetical protein
MSPSTIRCPNGHSNSAERKFCGDCGVPLAAVCPSGHPNAESALYCGECGAGIAEPMNPSAPPKFAVEHPELQYPHQLSEPGTKPSPGLWARTPRWGKIAVFAVPVAALVATLAILGVNFQSAHDQDQATGNQLAGGQSAETGRRDDSAPATGSRRHPRDSGVKTSGSKLEWLEAVCKPDGFINGLAGGTFAEAAAGGICTEPRAGGSDIFYTEWDNSDEMEKAIVGLSMCFVASIYNEANTTEVKVFSVLPDLDGYAPSLQPLVQFFGDPYCPVSK